MADFTPEEIEFFKNFYKSRVAQKALDEKNLEISTLKQAAIESIEAQHAAEKTALEQAKIDATDGQVAAVAAGAEVIIP